MLMSSYTFLSTTSDTHTPFLTKHWQNLLYLLPSFLTSWPGKPRTATETRLYCTLTGGLPIEF